MESTASSSSASSSNSVTMEGESVREAGPLPSKRGEIGFRESIHGQNAEERSNDAAFTSGALPARHPADREERVTSDGNNAVSSTANNITATSSSNTPDSSSITKKKGLLWLLKPKTVPSYGGLRLTTLLVFIFQLLLLGGTFTGWVFAAIAINRKTSGNNSNDPNNPGFSTAIFIHVAFAIASVAQIIFMERRIFRLRAERYAFVHPGAMLPTSRHRRTATDPAIALSPWNRPPLPTYAAALAQSGVGTGDVEDSLIAAPPPPAYGNTRGSTLLLANLLRASLGAQRPVSAHSQMSERSERPLSYVSRDEQWEEFCDAERARRLEETLANLERPASRR